MLLKAALQFTWMKSIGKQTLKLQIFMPHFYTKLFCIEVQLNKSSNACTFNFVQLELFETERCEITDFTAI